MSDGARQAEVGDAPKGRAGPILVVSSVALLIGAGLLLWHRSGGAVFGDMVMAALAWCF